MAWFKAPLEHLKKEIHEMVSAGETIITCETSDGDTRIDHDALRNILMSPAIGDRPIAIISIAGKLRTGKSFLLNYFLRYFRNKGWENDNWMEADILKRAKEVFVDLKSLPRFSFMHGPEGHTKGMRMWSQVLNIPGPDGKEIAVLLMDTQGLFDTKAKNENTNKALLTLSTLASSVQIFNCSQIIDTKILRYLKTCADYANAIAKEAEECYFTLQDMAVLIRDFPESEKYEYGFGGGKKYFKSQLYDNASEELRNVRHMFEKDFSNVKTFLLPHPGLKANKIAFKGTNAELESDFKTFVKIFVEGIASPQNIPVKMIKGKPVTARELLNMIVACDNIFALQMYGADAIMKANMKAYFSSAYEKAILEYDEKMKESTNSGRFIEDTKLNKYHEDAKKHALSYYNKSDTMGNGDCKEKYEVHLRLTCEQHFKTIRYKNTLLKKNVELKCARQTFEAICEYECLMQKDLEASGSLTLDSETLKAMHKRHLNTILEKYKGKVDEDDIKSNALNYLSEQIKLYDERRQIEKEMEQEERRSQLYKLTIQLDTECAKLWQEVRQEYQPTKKMQEKKRDIENKILKKYWNQALTETEKICAKDLKQQLYEEYQRACREFAKRHGLEPTTGDYQYAESEQTAIQWRETYETQLIRANMTGIIESFKNVLRICANNRSNPVGLKNKIEVMLGNFYDRCCGHLNKNCDEVKRNLEKRYGEAERRNENHWDIAKQEIDSKAEDVIIEQEEELEKVMLDRYINKDELEKYYDNMRQEIDNYLSSRPIRWAIPAHKLEEFRFLIEEKLKKSFKKMNKINEENREQRNVETKETPKLSWWQKIVRAIRRLFGLD